MDLWKEFIQKQRFTLFRTAIIQEQFIQVILDTVAPPARLLECGFGHGTTLVLLQDLGYDVQGFDNNEYVVEEFRKRFPGLADRVRTGDILDPGAYGQGFDVIISQGVMEHFSDEGILRILAIQRRCAGKILFDVPNRNREEFIDEGGGTRFESAEFWERIVTTAGLTFDRYGRNLDVDNDLLPRRLQKYNSGIMKAMGRSTIMVCHCR
jgi:trans-aconitate methyltransferase